MTISLEPQAVEAAFLEAARAELAALKPGNVHVHAAGHGMQAHQFEAAALAAAPIVADPSLSVGQRILRGVEASFAAAGCNTNLGILLLAAPLACAAQMASSMDGLRTRLARVLASLSPSDADDVYAAIRLANPGGLGQSEAADVAGPPTVSLLAAMEIAAPRDRIARAYVTDFEDLFQIGLPALKAAREAALSSEFAVTTLHMAYLARLPDSHIARKYGDVAAMDVIEQAQRLASAWTPAAGPATFASLLEFDARLKAQGLNPGTTADFVVATLMAERLAISLSKRSSS